MIPQPTALPYYVPYLTGPLPGGNRTTPQSLGVHVHFFALGQGWPLVTDRDLDLIQAAGFRRVNMDLLWSEVEKRPGVYDFSKYDWAIQNLLRRGIRPMIILGLGNPLYAQGLTIEPPHVREAYERYAMATVDHFKNRGLLWQIVNEPNHEFFWQPKPNPELYANLAMGLAPKLKMLDPSGVFIAPSTAGAPADFLERCFRHGLLQVVDAVAVHTYQAFPTKRIPEFFEREYMQARQLIDRYSPPGKFIPLLIGEWGYSTAIGEVDEQTQANFLVRQALLGMMVGTPVNITYDWKGDINTPGGNPAKKEHNFGLVRPDLQPKPSYFAMREMMQALAGQSFERRLPSKSDDYLLLFSNQRQATLAAWTIGSPHPVRIGMGEVWIGQKPMFIPQAAPMP
jgi:hypothetical protein